MNTDSITNLLHEISLEMAVLKRLPQRFNVFDLTEIKHYETRHSAVLAGILGWNGTRKPLGYFLKRIFRNNTFSEEQLQALNVCSEYSINIDGEERRLDILIRSSEISVVIENKIFTADHTKQLEAYSNWLKSQNCKHRCLVYLTLEGTSSSENFPAEKYVRLSWKTDILAFLGYCSSLKSLDTRFNSTVLQYAEFWENWFMQNDETTKKVCETILKTADSYLAAQKVFWTFKEAKHKLIRDTLCHWQIGKKENFSLWDKADDMSGGQCDKMSFKWNDRFFICFEFANYFSNLYYGVIGAEEEKSRTGFPGWSNSPWWPAYKYISNDKIRYLGDNGELCISDANTVYNVLDEAFEDTIKFLGEHLDYFGGKQPIQEKDKEL